MSDKNFSYHIFLFPFKWGKSTANAKHLFSELVDFEHVETSIKTDPRWAVNVYNCFNEAEDYNEYTYFYPTVRDVLYHQHSEPQKNEVIRHYHFTPAFSEALKYTIKVAGKIQKTYELDIDNILLNFYKTGIGILSFHLKNTHPNQQSWSDILTINEFGRRIYPPFFDYKAGKSFSTASAKASSLADEISISGIYNGGQIYIKEDFETITGLPKNYATQIPHLLQQVPNHIKQILPPGFVEQLNVLPVLDDRMFVVSSICDNEKTNSENIKQPEKLSEWKFLNQFYQYVFIDGPSSSGVANKTVQAAILKESQYLRWIDAGTLFGLSRYSFVCYTTWDKILVDTRTIYYKIVELCLLQRASVIKFSEEVRRISALNENENRLSLFINNIYKNYIIFINKIYFRDITPQEQGIELYDMLHEKMRIDKEVNDLDKEINELHEYARLQEERSNSSRLQLLTILGGLFIVPSFIASFFGMNDIGIKSGVKNYIIFILLATAAGSLATSLLAVQKNNHSQQKYIMGIPRFSWLLISISIFIILFTLLLLTTYNE